MSLSDLDIPAIKSRQQSTWASGNYAVIGTTLQLTGELLCEAVDIAAGERVVDVASGNGNAAVAAARRGGEVTACDYVPALLEGARARAVAEGIELETRDADAEALPFGDATFDVALSTFGVMFAPDQERAAAELLRVCKPGGRIGLANWTPGGFVGQMFKIVGRYVPPPAGLRSPVEWGTLSRLEELFGPGCAVRSSARSFVFRYRSADHWLATFRKFYGPTHTAFGALDAADAAALSSDLLALARQHDTSAGGSLRVPSDYIEVVVSPGRDGSET
jgi:SAM-dependent methyltransferase